MSTAATLTCPHCLQPFSPAEEAEHAATEQECGRCRQSLIVEAFPRMHIAEPPPKHDAASARLAQEGEAVCHFYPELQAQTVCDECGCFLSEKAAVAWGEKTLCLPCLHLLRETKNRDDFSARRTLVDNVGLGLVLLLLPLTLFTGPVALIYLLRNRKAPGSLIPRGRFRWWLAVSLATVSSLGWLLLIVLWILSIVSAITS